MANLTFLVVLGLVPKSAPKLIVRATAIANAIAADKTKFPAPNPPITQVTADIAALASAEALVKTHAVGTRVSRDAQQAVVVADLHGLHNYVQAQVNANPAQAEAIATAAAMTLKKAGAQQKPALAVKPVVSGTVKIVAKATKGGRSYEWQSSTDGGKTWNSLPTTAQATTTVTGLTPGVIVQFRHRAITKAGAADWTDPVAAVVQ